MDSEELLTDNLHTDMDVDEVLQEIEPDPVEESLAAEELDRQLHTRAARDMDIDLFLNKVVEGYVHDKWFGIKENYDTNIV